MAAPHPIPLTVIGGFLGAGKTTLLNRLLAEAGGKRLGLIVNDFGDINIDEKLIISRDEEMVSLANGCICCSIGSDFIRALISLVTRPDPPEQIIIEASGVADPARIAAIARADSALFLQGVLVLVDGLNFNKQLSDPLLCDTLEGQVCSADLLLLTKADIANDVEIGAVEACLRSLAVGTPLLRTDVRHLPVDLLFDLPRSKEYPAHTHHEHAFWTGSFERPGMCDLDLLKRVVADLPSVLLRLKGVVATSSGDLIDVQYVAGRLQLTAHGPAPVSPALVYIGVGEDRSEEVRRILAPAFSSSGDC